MPWHHSRGCKRLWADHHTNRGFVHDNGGIKFANGCRFVPDESNRFATPSVMRGEHLEEKMVFSSAPRDNLVTIYGNMVAWQLAIEEEHFLAKWSIIKPKDLKARELKDA